MPKRAKKLITDKRYAEANRIINKMLSEQRENDELWYLKGILLLKLGEYDAAMESFREALWIEKKPEYFKMQGMTNFELFELEDAIKNFQEAITLDKKDAVSHFFIALCYMFLDDPKSQEYVKKAYKLNKKRTTELVRNFYQVFFSKTPFMKKTVKDALEKEIEEIS